MKSYYELTLEEQFERCEQALSILANNANSSTVTDRAYQLLDVCTDEGIEDENVKKLRKEILNANECRGYSNKCGLSEVSELLN